jgi:hypothetical protein
MYVYLLPNPPLYLNCRAGPPWFRADTFSSVILSLRFSPSRTCGWVGGWVGGWAERESGRGREGEGGATALPRSHDKHTISCTRKTKTKFK